VTADQQGIVRKPPVKGRRFLAVDLDGTLAFYDKWRGREHIGEPIPAMVTRVKEWLAKGDVVCIFTSRVAEETDPEVYARVHAWCEKHIGERLYVTATKHRWMVEFWDDRNVLVETNTGRVL